MRLESFAVVHRHVEPLDRVLIHWQRGRQVVMVFIGRDALDDYFPGRRLKQADRNLVVDRSLALLMPVIIAKYDAGETGIYRGGGQDFETVTLSLADLLRTAEALTDSVLDMAAASGYRAA
jgi:hypothetical protein